MKFTRKPRPQRPDLPLRDAGAEVDAALATLASAPDVLRSARAPDAAVAEAEDLLASAEGPGRLLQEGRGLPRDLEELQALAAAAAQLVAEFG
jgi:hypothetical protein